MALSQSIHSNQLEIYRFPAKVKTMVNLEEKDLITIKWEPLYREEVDEIVMICNLSDIVVCKQEKTRSENNDSDSGLRFCYLSTMSDGEDKNPIEPIGQSSAEREISCRYCDKVFRIYSSRYMHERRRHGRQKRVKDPIELAKQPKFACGYCSSLFNSKKARYMHERRHHDRPKRSVKDGSERCSLCVKSFCSKQSLRRHEMRFHGDVLPTITIATRSLDHPKRNIKEKDPLELASPPNDHPEQVIKEKIMKCIICGISFSNPSALRGHEVSFHGTARLECTDMLL